MTEDKPEPPQQIYLTHSHERGYEYNIFANVSPLNPGVKYIRADMASGGLIYRMNKGGTSEPEPGSLVLQELAKIRKLFGVENAPLEGLSETIAAKLGKNTEAEQD